MFEENYKLYTCYWEILFKYDNFIYSLIYLNKYRIHFFKYYLRIFPKFIFPNK